MADFPDNYDHIRPRKNGPTETRKRAIRKVRTNHGERVELRNKLHVPYEDQINPNKED
jgi:hypothetical protein